MNDTKNAHVSTCGRCGLEYHNASSMRDHTIDQELYVCKYCGLKYDTEIERDVHRERIKSAYALKYEETKLINVCEVCFLFFKSSKKQRYDYLNDHSEVGKYQKCDRCEKSFFNIKVVKRATWRKVDKEYIRKKKTNSNESRLKVMQKRLKMIHKLRKL